MTEQMFGRVPLNLVVTAIKDGTHGTHARVDNGIPFLSAKNITDSGEVSWNETDDRISDSEYEQIHRVFQLQPRDLLLTIVGSLGRRAVFDGAKVTFQRSVAYVRPDRRRVSERFLFHWFAHGEFQRELVRRSNSTAQAGLYLGELARTLVPDCPLTEQIKIAEVLDTLDSTIRQTQAIIDKLKQVKQGLLHDLLTRGIADNGELRPPQSEAPHLYKESALGWIPMAWRCETVGTAIESPPRNGIYKPASDIGAGTLLVGQTAFTSDGSVDFMLARRARVTNGECETFGLQESDLLVSRVFATREGVGQPVIIPRLAEPAVYESNMMRLRVRRELIASRLLFLWLKHRTARAWIMSRAFASNQASINQETLCSVPLPLPSHEEQGAILAALGAQEGRLRNENLTLVKQRALKSGLMDDLLTGRVRVTALLNAET